MDIYQQLKTSPAFSGVPEKFLFELLDSGVEVQLEKNQILFHQGDAVDSFYIVLSGRVLALLEAEGKSQVVSDILPGEVIGEMTLLSNRPRTLTVRAAVPSKLLKIVKKSMIRFCLKNPKVLINIINVLAERSSQTLKLLSTPRKANKVAVVNLNADPEFTDYYQKFIDAIAHERHKKIAYHPPVKEALAIDSYQLFAEYMKQQSTNDELIFQELNIAHTFFNGCFVESASHELIFVKASDDPQVLSQYREVTDLFRLDSTKKRYLVLVHRADRKMPMNTARWLDQGKFSGHFHMRLGNAADLASLVRFMLGRAIGLVVSGGAARTIVGIGAVLALLDRNIPIDAIGGTSAGAAFASMILVNDHDVDGFRRDCNSIIQTTKNWNKLSSITWPLISIFNSKSATENLRKICCGYNIEDLWRPFFAISCNYINSQEMVHRSGVLWRALRASTALPGMVPPCVIDGDAYIDGGVMNNFPTDIMRSIVGDDGLVVGVNSFTMVENVEKYNFPPVLTFFDALFTRLGWRNRHYVFPRFTDLVMKTLFSASRQRQFANRNIADVVVEPDLRNFSFSSWMRFPELIKIGYDETIKQIDDWLAKHKDFL